MIPLMIISVIVFVLLAMASGISPVSTTLSRFELERRQAKGDKTASQALQREMRLADVVSLQRIAVALLLVLLVALLVTAFGWLLGIILSVIAVLMYGAAGRMPLLHGFSQRTYVMYEPGLLGFIKKYQSIFAVFRSVTPQNAPVVQLHSREELGHLVENAGSLLTADEKKLVAHGLTFGEREVKEIMTPRGVIDSISKKELLGPLVLDDLHKTGHSRFPVTDGDIDHVVGMLHIHELLTLDAKRRSTSVEKAMEPRVFYIREDQTLEHALAAFLRTHHHLFVVINEFRETVGVLSLEDVVEALLGRKIIDEFDAHDDLRAVAARNPRGNNHSKNTHDV